MIFSQLLTEAYRLLEDPNRIAWPNSAIVRHLNAALRSIGSAVGDSGRTTLSLVQGQQAYDLPAGVRRIREVRIAPESGSEPLIITQRRLEEMRINVPQEGDPSLYAVQLTSGANEDQFGLFMWPAPARSTADAIIIDYEIEYELDSDDPATVPQEAQVIPFPRAYEMAILYLTIGSALSERDDDSDIQKSEHYWALGQRQLTELQPTGSASKMIDAYRPFP